MQACSGRHSPSRRRTRVLPFFAFSTKHYCGRRGCCMRRVPPTSKDLLGLSTWRPNSGRPLKRHRCTTTPHARPSRTSRTHPHPAAMDILHTTRALQVFSLSMRPSSPISPAALDEADVIFDKSVSPVNNQRRAEHDCGHRRVTASICQDHERDQEI